MRALTAWQRAEGGSASFNPLNTTQPLQGASNYNGVGVRNYPSAQAGLAATKQTLLNGHYNSIVGLLRSGKASADQIGTAVEQSPWGTGGGVLKVLGSKPTNLGNSGAQAKVPALSLGSGGGTAGAQQALAAMMLQQSSMTASGQPDSSSLLAMAMARQQMQAAQQVYGSAPSTSQSAPPPSLAPGKGLVPIDGTKYLANRAIIPQVDNITKQFGVSVNSAYRSPDHNAAVGGAKNSDHLSGNAIDFVGTPQQMKALYTWAQGKFPYVEPWGQAGGNHVHISFIR